MNYQALANAVVLQAVKDYRRARQRLKRFPSDKNATAMCNECERFFLSDRFALFTNLDGYALLEKLRKE